MSQTTMTRALFERMDLSHRRRLFAVGDIHGRFDLLEQKLEEAGFDRRQGDFLILLGDLVDRGDYNEEALAWCQKPWVARVRGNHDQMVHRSVIGSDRSRLLHIQNGGLWFFDIEDPAERQRWSDIIVDCPIAIEATTPGGRRVGFVHADVPTESWADLEGALAASRQTLASSDPLDRESIAWRCMWQRDRIDDLKHFVRETGGGAGHDCTVPDIDHVFFGHSIVQEPITHGNCSWIDTGAFKRDVLTLVDVDAWIASSTSRRNAA